MDKDICIEGTPSHLSVEANVLLLSAHLPVTCAAVHRIYTYSYPHLKPLHQYNLPNFKQSDECVDAFTFPEDFHSDENSNSERTKNNENGARLFHQRCCLSKDGKYAVIGEECGISREFIVNVQDGSFLQRAESAFTVIIKDYKPFVSFTQSECLKISILRPCKDIHGDKVVLGKMSQQRVGRRLIGKPLVMGSNNHVIFMQISFQGQLEVCVFDISLDKEAIVCRSNYHQLNIPKKHKITNIFLEEKGCAVWFYYEHMDGKNSKAACLWMPKLEKSSMETNSGDILGNLVPQGELFPLIPQAVESDFFRIITKPTYSSKSKSIPLFEWRDELTLMYKHLFASWIGRRRSSYDSSQIIIETIYDGKYAIIYCPLINNVYVMDWNTGFLNYKIKFKHNRTSHLAVFGRFFNCTKL